MTKLEQAEMLIAKAEQMRKWQKEYLCTRDGLTLRKAKEIEKELDEMLVAYRGGNLLVNILGDDPNQLNIFDK